MNKKTKGKIIMCITSARAQLSNTLIYAGEANKDGKNIHVLAYQNIATDKSNNPNAMIIPFPTSTPMSEKNIIDTRPFKTFLKDISAATKRQTRMLSASKSMRNSADALVFDVGSYTVVLADHTDQIYPALERVPEHKRPSISARFLAGYNLLYPDQPVAVCCWSGHLEAEPLLWWYEPTNKDTLFIPTMDAHDGNAPDLNARVDTDHIISVGSAVSPRGASLRYTANIPNSVKGLLPTHVHGTRVESTIKNGDMFMDVQELRSQPHGPLLKRGSSVNNLFWETPMYGWS